MLSTNFLSKWRMFTTCHRCSDLSLAIKTLPTTILQAKSAHFSLKTIFKKTFLKENSFYHFLA